MADCQFGETHLTRHIATRPMGRGTGAWQGTARAHQGMAQCSSTARRPESHTPARVRRVHYGISVKEYRNGGAGFRTALKLARRPLISDAQRRARAHKRFRKGVKGMRTPFDRERSLVLRSLWHLCAHARVDP